MKTLTDQYDFSRPSLSGKYGFEIFEDEEKNLFYFHFNDRDGGAILFSQGYQSAKSRDGGQESVIKNAGKEGRYHRQRTESGQPFFVIKAGNYQEIARSKAFGSEEEMEKAISLAQTIDENTPVVELAEEKEKALSTKDRSFQPFEKLSRYKFSMIYYPESRVWKLTHDFSGRGGQFEELGSPEFLEFVRQFLPEDKPSKISGESWKEDIRHIELVSEQKKWEGKAIEGGIPVKAEFVLPAGNASDKPRHYDARVFARSLENATHTFIGEVEADLPSTGSISVPLHLESLRPGIYRIIAKVGLEEEGHKKEELRGSRLIQLV